MLLLAIVTGNAWGSVLYTVTDLGTLPGYPGCSAEAINASGRIVGEAETISANSAHTFLYSNGTTTDLGTLGGPNSNATGINASGQVTGNASITPGSPGPDHAFLYSNGTMTDLGTLGGQSSGALGINDSGQVVGQSYTANDNSMDPFLYSNGKMTDIGAVGYHWGTAYAINDNGQVVDTADHCCPVKLSDP